MLDLPLDSSERCPICGGKGCAIFIGYYERQVIDEKGTYYKAFPIGRYKCRRKGWSLVVDHVTFSLLPYQLVPYTRYSIPYIIKVLTLRHIEGKSIYQLQDYLASFDNGEEQYLDLNGASLYFFRALVLESIDKMLVSGNYPETEKEFSQPGSLERLKMFIGFAESFECFGAKPSIRGPCGLSYDFYLQGGGYFRNSYFLFGSPSQFR